MEDIGYLLFHSTLSSLSGLLVKLARGGWLVGFTGSESKALRPRPTAECVVCKSVWEKSTQLQHSTLPPLHGLQTRRGQNTRSSFFLLHCILYSAFLEKQSDFMKPLLFSTTCFLQPQKRISEYWLFSGTFSTFSDLPSALRSLLLSLFGRESSLCSSHFRPFVWPAGQRC